MPIFDAFPNGSGTFTRGKLANLRGNPGNVVQAVTDGDTIRLRLPGGQGFRMLGCDTPEKSIEHPSGGFIKLSDPRWQNYIDTIWTTSKWGPFKVPLSPALLKYIKKKLNKQTISNHWKHANDATTALAELVEADRKKLKKTDDSFGIFAAFSHETLDRYGRPLVFLNADEKDEAKRPEIYNLRMIANGRATPFFMWPNIEPFRKLSVTDAAMPPAQLRKAVARARKLQAARKAAKSARKKKIGIYASENPLQLMAFELRYLARRETPSRWLINISDSAKDKKLLPPETYISIPEMEDILFIPTEYVPLFRAKGWT